MVTTKFYVAKYASYAGVGFIFMLLQNLPIYLNQPVQKPLLLFALAMVVAVIEKETVGAIFAIYCGWLCDLFSDYSFGYYALALFFLCMGTGVVCRGFVRPSMSNCAFFTLISILLVQWLGFFFTVYIIIEGATIHFFVAHFLPVCILTTITVPPIFWLQDKIWTYFQRKIDLA